MLPGVGGTPGQGISYRSFPDGSGESLQTEKISAELQKYCNMPDHGQNSITTGSGAARETEAGETARPGKTHRAEEGSHAAVAPHSRLEDLPHPQAGSGDVAHANRGIEADQKSRLPRVRSAG